MRLKKSAENSRDEEEGFRQDEDDIEIFQEGVNPEVEDNEAEVLGVGKEDGKRAKEEKRQDEEEERAHGHHDWLKRFDEWRRRDEPPELAQKENQRHKRAALAYKFGNT
jgi:hypothetical protein